MTIVSAKDYFPWDEYSGGFFSWVLLWPTIAKAWWPTRNRYLHCRPLTLNQLKQSKVTMLSEQFNLDRMWILIWQICGIMSRILCAPFCSLPWWVYQVHLPNVPHHRQGSSLGYSDLQVWATFSLFNQLIQDVIVYPVEEWNITGLLLQLHQGSESML